ncbi:MAG TPA: flagellar motor protein [Symbiobacteriaceae bacterium]|nr:flagellar motor protein [Symbiobacteriaceae bacterium]
MDLTTLVGLLLGFGAILASVFMEGGKVSSLIQAPAFVLIFFGTLGASIVGTRSKDLRAVPKALGSAFMRTEQDPYELIDRLVQMAERARREGLLALQDDVASLGNPLLIRGVQMIVDGTDPEVVKATMETQVELDEHRKLSAASFLDSAGGYAPTIGIIGTVMGMVNVLSNLSNPEQLAHSIALAFLATFYGILTANLVWLPLGKKVKENIAYETLLGKMCVAGVTGLQTGEAPRSLREKLEAYISEASPAKRAARGGDDR